MEDACIHPGDSTQAIVWSILRCAHKGHIEHVEEAITEHRERLTGLCLDGLTDCCNATTAGVAYMDLMTGLDWKIAKQHATKTLEHLAEYCKSEEAVEFVLRYSTLFQPWNETRDFWNEVDCAAACHENDAMKRVSRLHNGWCAF
ncbi:hypothetical protein [Medusavirus stheno T3]|uniref:Uncharacterized protein n=1 Tax=Medusavirus stheno T3 TaxID=3069717 RepID=A0A7S7YEU0_9VIRU|nr:hypothetical protein QKU73_gp325 [Acanthamoeba castellanii medusavirus]QPB44450.1 hypothetical protein [Medusavirus stheno T3]